MFVSSVWGVGLSLRKVNVCGRWQDRGMGCESGTAVMRVGEEVVVGGGGKVRFRGLLPDSFRHPIDVQATRMMKGMLGMEFVLRRVLRPVERVFFIDNISQGILVGPEQLPEIHKALAEAAEILDIPIPQLFVKQNPVPNAYTLAFQGQRPFIVVHTSLVDLLSLEELQSVLAHELGHLKCEHGIFVTLANIIALASANLGGEAGAALGDWINFNVLRWLRAAEFSCDRASLLVTQDPAVVISSLMKLVGGSQSISSKLNVEAFSSQVRALDEASNDQLGRVARRLIVDALTHPLPVVRVRELQRYSESQEYKALMKRFATTNS
uniref:Peptidase M48 domain-containing protein n=1 Tax=Compsopogon caeruleus TaxID=31354 RepID=A0A6T6C3N9_9RHOD|mmetsp:Transcript_17044/g.35425  ORF Transcript_17044/g.35425 Transcript_17044/m.35425 type:complete len:324 (+) Transcript_17044:143-1114(+)|eukprot:CAMPEP_0184681806 /NCGR_PEP_ID=MMETSP0312-20130426/4801_1 /TAXON_ID=31354 /ORGANISM="Compsopogon coeruleus, Strain SAG 36.94" /LENGTH=323 /DNA_ID=CAMNT_0027132895 /DNA_START=137 /DNA_END=1108 /DNA_ORIENTATION=+